MVGHPPTLSEGECEVLSVEVLRGEQPEGQQRKASITIRTDAHDSPRRGIGGRYPVRSKQVPDGPLSRSQKAGPAKHSQPAHHRDLHGVCMASASQGLTGWPPPLLADPFSQQRPAKGPVLSQREKEGQSAGEKEKRARTASPLRCSHRKPVALQVKIKAPTQHLKTALSRVTGGM